MYRLYYVSVVDIIKNLILSEFFSKEIEFTIVQFAHRLFRVLSASTHATQRVSKETDLGDPHRVCKKLIEGTPRVSKFSMGIKIFTIVALTKTS